jgi:hypothetical protein
MNTRTWLAATAALIPIIALPSAGLAGATSAAPKLCGTPTSVDLVAGQSTDAGSVTIGNNADELIITISTDSSWAMSASHVHPADTLAAIPQTNKGNPKIGNFAHQRGYVPPATSDTYVIPRSALSLDANEALVVAVHAALVRLGTDGSVVGSETGWASGKTFVDRGSWAMYSNYLWQDCKVDASVETVTQTAFAKGSDSTCFLDLDLDGDGTKDFNRWGWTNGPLTEGDHSFELYAGAGRCDTSKGTDVGRVTVSYRNGTAVVTFITEGTNPVTGQPYTMADAHAYVGTELLPLNNGAFTVAPGQYPQVLSEAGNKTSVTFTFTGLSGPVHLVAHTSVVGFPVT